MTPPAIDELGFIATADIRPWSEARSSTLAARLIMRLGREPVVHFLLIAVLLYGIGALARKPAAIVRRTRIEVSSAEINRLKRVWTAQWRRPPDAQELRSLVDDYVREEVLFREALAMGLDRGDEIARRRLVQKMEFLERGGAVDLDGGGVD
jgi:hypothetical protein